METFEEKVERYMQCDKRTLAELLAMKELVNDSKKENYQIDEIRPIEPYYKQQLDPIEPYYKRLVPNTPPFYGDWVITCSI